MVVNFAAGEVRRPFVEQSGELPDEAVVREAVSNVVRHSAARSATVSVTVDDDLTISVTDDGVGISEGITRSGLANLAARANECGGQFSIAPRPGGGTRLVWSAPLP